MEILKKSKPQNISYNGKETNRLPKGAKIMKKDYNIRVEEIENGFIICKSYNVEYTLGDNKEYSYFEKKWFSEENPLDVSLDEEDKYLADEF